MKPYQIVLIVIAFIVTISAIYLFKKNRASQIPLKDFFKNPEKTGFQLSPDGKHISFLKPWKKRLNIYVKKIGEKKETRITSASNRDIGGYFWANNSRIAYVQDEGGDENYKLFGVNIDGTNLKTLTPFDKVRVQIIDDLEENENEMIIGLNKRDPKIFDAYRLEINSGKLDLIAENPGNISGWLTDNDGKLRIATTTDGVNTGILYRDKESDNFKNIITTNFKETLAPLYFTFDNKYIYAGSNLGRDKMALVKYDIANNKEMELIFEHDEVDVSTLLRSRKRKIITGAVYTTDKKHIKFFDKQRESLQADLERRLPGYEVVISSMSKDETKLLVRTYSDKTRGAYFYYDLSKKEFYKLHEVSPWLDETLMSDVKPIKYKSRDGLTINGYLTLPKNIEAKNIPVIINPHGGPWTRDYWGFNPETQFLVSRGYAVLKMNYRGSTGYGKKFWQMSFKQWGKKMQDDISDGVKWLIDEGIADPDRVAIYGASYGGYATLAGLAFTPDLYACGVDYVGVSNIFTLLETMPPYWEQGRQMMYEMIGDPVKDKDLLKEVSPVFHADKIKAPLFVAQGANDPRVKKSESDQIVEALKKRGIDVPYMVKDNEGHGFHNEENRFDFYHAMEKFLNKHLIK